MILPFPTTVITYPHDHYHSSSDPRPQLDFTPYNHCHSNHHIRLQTIPPATTPTNPTVDFPLHLLPIYQHQTHNPSVDPRPSNHNRHTSHHHRNRHKQTGTAPKPQVRELRAISRGNSACRKRLVWWRAGIMYLGIGALRLKWRQSNAAQEPSRNMSYCTCVCGT